MNKRGLSEIVTGVIIIILAIVAVAIIWSFIKPTLEKTGSEIELVSEISSPIKIKSVQENTGTLNILIEKNKGTSNVNLKGIVFTIEDSEGKTYTTEQEDSSFENLKEFETKSNSITFTKNPQTNAYLFGSVSLSNIKKVSARAKIEQTSSGKERLSRTSSSFVIGGSGGGGSSGGGSGGPPPCTPINYYQELDLDTFGDTTQVQSSCTQPSGYVTNDEDCNDESNLINPIAKEICEISGSIIVTDDDCDGDIDLQDDNCWWGGDWTGSTDQEWWCKNTDFNRNGEVTIGDLGILAQYLYDATTCNEGNTWCNGIDANHNGIACEKLENNWCYGADVDRDGFVTIGHMTLYQQYSGNNCLIP